MSESIISALNVISAGSINVTSGHYIREILQFETAGNKVLGGIAYGNSLDINNNVIPNIVGSYDCEANSSSKLIITDYRNPSTIYYNAGENWNGANVNIYIVLGSLT